MTESQWKPIEGFNRYWISDDGEVINLHHKRVLKGSWANGVYFVTLTKDGVQYNRSVKKLMQEAFSRSKDDNEHEKKKAASKPRPKRGYVPQDLRAG